jgi:hypothetical protein
MGRAGRPHLSTQIRHTPKTPNPPTHSTRSAFQIRAPRHLLPRLHIPHHAPQLPAHLIPRIVPQQHPQWDFLALCDALAAHEVQHDGNELCRVAGLRAALGLDVGDDLVVELGVLRQIGSCFPIDLEIGGGQ